MSHDNNYQEFNELIAKLRTGDEQTFVQVYEKLAGYVAFVCSKFCDNPQDAEEVVQEVFAIAFKKVNDIQPEAFVSYLRRVAINESIRKRDATYKQENIQTELDEQSYSLVELNENFLPAQHFENEESKVALLKVIKSLPKRQWEMIYMYYFAEFSTKEIAEMLGCTEIHVRKTMHIARQNLKDKLGSKTAAKALVLLPLASLFLLEEQAFAASYTPTVIAGGVVAGYTTTTSTTGATTGTTAATVATTATKLATPYIIAACVAAVCAIAAVSYFVLTDFEPREAIVFEMESEFSGTGRETTEPFFLEAGQHVVTITNRCTAVLANFQVRFRDYETSGWVRGAGTLANHFGNVDLQFSINIPEDGYYYLDVNSRGDWTVGFTNNIPTNPPDITVGFSGTGDAVVFFSSAEAQDIVLEFYSPGRTNRHFTVEFNNRRIVRVSDINVEHYQRVLHLPGPGVFYFEVRTSGDWTIVASELGDD